jgi:hypothetical protein
MALEPYFEAIEPWLTAMTTSFRPAAINGPTVELDTPLPPNS